MLFRMLLARCGALALALVGLAMGYLAIVVWISDGLSWGVVMMGGLAILGLWAGYDLLRRKRIGWQHCAAAALLAGFWLLARTG